MDYLPNGIAEARAEMDSRLRVDENFDVVRRQLCKGDETLVFYCVNGFVKDEVMSRLMGTFLACQRWGTAREFAAGSLPYVEVEPCREVEALVRAVLAGATVILGSSFGGEGLVVETRSYPARQTEEPQSDKVMQGAKDGFVETLVCNTALIRRRLRDPRLTMKHLTLRGAGTDVVVAYVDGVADPALVRQVQRRLGEIAPGSLTLGTQSLAELLIPRRWWNPFPKVRTLERPDAAAAELCEGRVLILCDTSPRVMVLPTSLFDYLQETNDYYFPPLTGSYQRLVRLAMGVVALTLTPLWYLYLHYADVLPDALRFLVPRTPGILPVFLQLLLAELAVDALKLASMNTPSLLSNSLSVIGGLILGDFAVTVGWLCPDVILYMSMVAIAGFAQKSQDLIYAMKFHRLLLLALTGLGGVWGFGVGVTLFWVLVLANTTLNGGHSYLYPMVPMDPGAMLRLLFRLPKWTAGDGADRKGKEKE